VNRRHDERRILSFRVSEPEYITDKLAIR
jgi:hypothetical protein